jgi:hypothetical protein
MSRISVSILTCVLLVFPALVSTASAQTDDATYCAQLGALATKYLGSAGGNGGTRPNLDTVEAIEDCRKGNTAKGIPVLENKLRASGFTLPKR